MAHMQEALEALADPSIRYIVPVSGGKDSAALAIYMAQTYPQIPTEYVFCDTDAELPETYDYLDRLAALLGKPIHRRYESRGCKGDPCVVRDRPTGLLSLEVSLWLLFLLLPTARRVATPTRDASVTFIGRKSTSDRRDQSAIRRYRIAPYRPEKESR